jgi:hypothetical protein
MSVGFTHVALVTSTLGSRGSSRGGGTPFSDPVTVDAGANAGARAVYVRDLMDIPSS